MFLRLFSIGLALSLFSGVNARSCTSLKTSGMKILCTFRDSNDAWLLVEPKRCHNYSRCCFFNNTCYSDLSVSAESAKQVKSNLEIKMSKKQYMQQRFKAASSSLNPVSKRLLTFPTVGGFPGCPKSISFPESCKPQVDEPYVVEPPLNIPYCLRIPCSPENKENLDRSQQLCGTQAGCYFDLELHEYRKAFGEAVLPGVPVCQLAIRNAVFQTKAALVAKKYGSWNPYFTNCLLNEFKEDISAGPKGCDLIAVLKIFKVNPKMAGWSKITSGQCFLIDGCWIRGEGCFYPVDISSVLTKSGQRSLQPNKYEIVYGRPKCQHFDSSSSYSTLKSYHQCLKSGCSVDKTVLNSYYPNLFAIGESMSVGDHWKYWTDVEGGRLGAHNIDEISFAYDKLVNASLPAMNFPPSLTPLGLPFSFPNSFSDPLSLLKANAFPRSENSFNFFPSLFPLSNAAVDRTYTCGIQFKYFGGRPCKPPTFNEMRSSYCPYIPLKVPKFPPLRGSFEGCCDINLCYLAKREISKMHSGPSHYYTVWSYWSPCTTSCGVGQKSRLRKCISEDETKCTEAVKQVATCQRKVCPEWGQWGPFSPCPKSCFPGGKSSRKRVCSPPREYCVGQNEEVQVCNDLPCPTVDSTATGVWSTWKNEQCKYNYSKRLCEQSRIRYCMLNGKPAENCVGSSTSVHKWNCQGCA